MDISVVIPLFNEIESLKELHDWIKRVMHTNNFTYEIIFVDDGSTDNSWQVIEELSAKNKEIRGIKFRRNHGKAAALFCGFEHVKGEVIITMDADLQDSPDEIPDLYKMITVDNFDLVSGWKKKRHDPITKTIPTKLYNATARKVSKIKLHDFNCGLKAYKKNVIKSIEVYGEMHRYMPILAKQAGFKRIGEKVVQHQERKYGVTKFGIERFVNGFLDLISISFISKFSKRPMHFFGTIGTIMFLSGGFVSIWLIAKKIYNVFNHLPVREIVEQPLFYIALLSIIIGVQLFLAGFLAELVSRSSPERNKYNVEKTI
ncbi:MAG: glycosyltransferase family 2 protein [Bacteroidetes bacterium]|jgi:glycosyltransferase involved in cell wall biosynthesis|nr:glycosyltransferase family 2 protein [Bacteroidota bacterium]MBT6687238.1 glycosyltransferase family 2 protein [Bacteroidota bacterium]MBT7144011.1 glycosyltransferase family 2 protein [Bacteroidota bacterium]MBT7493170.1 glycosyltransferase family 2 protein [Bacteroidota bacterium]